MKLRPLTEGPDRETLTKLIATYRLFVGEKLAFDIEHRLWPGELEDEEEANEFHNGDFSAPANYEIILLVLDAYRRFVGREVAFRIEHHWWPSRAERDFEDLDIGEIAELSMDDYETVRRKYRDTALQLAVSERLQEEFRLSRAFWRVCAIALGVGSLAVILAS